VRHGILRSTLPDRLASRGDRELQEILSEIVAEIGFGGLVKEHATELLARAKLSRR
jgi:hypothetical protein